MNHISKFFLLASKGNGTSIATSTPEERAIGLQRSLNLKKEFGAYLKTQDMRRDLSLLEKRRVFVAWYLEKYQNQKNLKQVTYELSEILFVSTRTVEEILFKKS